MITRQDQQTGQHLDFVDADFLHIRQDLHDKNHLYSSRLKARGGRPAAKEGISIGDLVFIKNEGDKFNRRPQYLFTSSKEGFCILQRMTTESSCQVCSRFQSRICLRFLTGLFRSMSIIFLPKQHSANFQTK